MSGVSTIVAPGAQLLDPTVLSRIGNLELRAKLVVEPSGAVPLAAAFEHPLFEAGTRVGVILSGGNIDLNLLPRISALNLLSTSTLTLANSFIDHERSIGVERELKRMLLNFSIATDRSAIDGSRFESFDAAVLIPLARRLDLEVNVGQGRSDLFDAGVYGGLLFLVYGR